MQKGCYLYTDVLFRSFLLTDVLFRSFLLTGVLFRNFLSRDVLFRNHLLLNPACSPPGLASETIQIKQTVSASNTLKILESFRNISQYSHLKYEQGQTVHKTLTGKKHKQRDSSIQTSTQTHIHRDKEPHNERDKWTNRHTENQKVKYGSQKKCLKEKKTTIYRTINE